MILVGALSFWLALLLASWSTLVSSVGARMQRADLVISGQRAMALTAIALVLASAGVWQAIRVGEFRMVEVQRVAAGTPSSSDAVAALSALLVTPSLWLLSTLTVLSIVAALLGRLPLTAGAPRVDAAQRALLGGALSMGLLGSALWLAPYQATLGVASVLDGVEGDARTPAFVMHRITLAIGAAIVVYAIGCLVARQLLRRQTSPAAPMLVAGWLVMSMALGAGWWWRYAIDGVVDVRSGHWSLRVALVGWGVATIGLTLLPRATMRLSMASRAVVWGGVLLAGAGLLAQDWARVQTMELPASTARPVADAFGARWTMISQGASYFVRDGYESLLLAIALQRGTQRAGLVTTEQRRYSPGPGEAPPDQVLRGVHRGIAQDLFVRLAGSSGRDVAVVEVRFVPGVNLLWLGLGLVGIGLTPLTRRRVYA